MKPMLACDAKEINFPVYASPKLDGIRAIIVDGKPLSRSLKVLPNLFIQTMLSDWSLSGLDGEIVVGEPNDPNAMQKTSSGVMSEKGNPDFTYYVFDYWTNPDTPFKDRYIQLAGYFESCEGLLAPRIKLLEQVLIANQEELDTYETKCLEEGYEGVMVRSLNGKYKYGRSTAKEGILLKVKRFVDAEAVVIGFEELLHNANEATIDELGNTKRSSHIANKVPMGTLGALICRDIKTNVVFNLGTGYTAKQRQEIWDSRDTKLGDIATYKSFPTGVKDKPRIPVFKSFRNKIDM